MKNIIRIIRVLIIRILSAIFSSKANLAKGKILILAPHPDDEVFGCSGLIQQQITFGREVYIIFMTRGESSHRNCCDIDRELLKTERAKLTDYALSLLGVKQHNVFRLSYPDGSLSYCSEETQKLKNLIELINPDAIFVPHSSEGWNDHIETQNIAMELITNKNIELYAYCVWFWFYNVWNIDWNNAFTLKMTSEQKILKDNAINIYIDTNAPCGRPYSGVLPKVFVWANRWSKELYFKIK